ncbi:MAG: aminopeptidase [Candidatus Magasanikbacteria bacterium CG10_big_fil_rev_8_21_14_0_10_36_32]|uniref:Aminopeptidase n=1 Tax=Candidatus Magasanikbacteria bacterium CG10_big_fil_rev_8_21_14_0_10_36_32 TaxID=1974646 RepID=A0A2M6W6S4_9BACT|nr:MAG: aminopeptidase [Candidatus Magasanikbacteria bacterium CG10_big_fil_rev_8_21_14_0_10_36_32]
MFTKKILERYAQVLVWALEQARAGSGGIYRPGDIVSITFHIGGLKLAEAVHKTLLSKGLCPVLELRQTAGMESNFYKLANDQQMEFRTPWCDQLCHSLNGDIYILAPDSISHLVKTDPKKLSRRAIILKQGQKILEKREECGEYGWTLCCLPTAAQAAAAGMTIREYGNEIIRACYLDNNNPVAIWESLTRKSQHIKNWLKQLDIRHVHVESDNIDLSVNIGQDRKWVGFSGCNIPGFEIFTSPDYRGTNGIYYSNMPSYRLGHLIRGVRLEFKQGDVVRATAEEGEDFLRGQLNTDTGAKRLGEFSLTDKRMSPISRFMAETLYDENVGNPNGNCHVAIGNSYSDTYSGNEQLNDEKKSLLGFNDSAIHWDLVNTESKRVTALLKGGVKKVIYDDGIFLVD